MSWLCDRQSPEGSWFSKAEFPFLMDRQLSQGAASGPWGEVIHKRKGEGDFIDVSLGGDCHADAHALGQVGSRSFSSMHACLPSSPV